MLPYLGFDIALLRKKTPWYSTLLFLTTIDGTHYQNCRLRVTKVAIATMSIRMIEITLQYCCVTSLVDGSSLTVT